MSERLKRGRDAKKMDKPYKGREVVHTCSNGWTIEVVIPEDAEMEAFFMGHCLDGSYMYEECLSLREPDGTPHVTILGTVMTGRCNMAPKEKYAKLCNEFRPFKSCKPTKHALQWSVNNRREVAPEV